MRPVDAANIELVRQVHPLDHVDPEPPEKYNLGPLGQGGVCCRVKEGVRVFGFLFFWASEPFASVT